MTDQHPVIVAPSGRAARTKADDRCPGCRAPKSARINTAGFGPPQIHCGECGHPFPGETETGE